MPKSNTFVASVLSVLFDRPTFPKAATSWTAGNRY